MLLQEVLEFEFLWVESLHLPTYDLIDQLLVAALVSGTQQATKCIKNSHNPDAVSTLDAMGEECLCNSEVYSVNSIGIGNGG